MLWVSGSIYPDYESNTFDQYVTREEGGLFPTSGVNIPEIQRYPSYTSTNIQSSYPINKTRPRPCDKRVDLYILQPDRLNTSGLFNPLKGKLTNCHSTGCER